MEERSARPGTEKGAGRLRVLLVEDDRPVAEALEILLESLGHHVVGIAGDGPQAVDHASKLLPDLILMDIKLPIMEGTDAARAILAQRPVPIVLLTGYADEPLVQRAKEAGVMAYLLKPVDERQLRSTIEVSLARFEELDSLKREVSSLKEELETRKLVEQAKGILMKRLNLSEPEAFRRMQQHSRSRRTALRDIAEGILGAEQVLAPFEKNA